MIISCDNCNKKFELDKNLIPPKGRILQCGSCNHKWLFRIENDSKKIKDENISKNEEVRIFEKDSDNNLPTYTEKIINEAESTLKKNVKLKVTDSPIKKKETRHNYFNVFLVIILSILALILIVDTFKHQLIFVFPDVEIILDNLYQSITDIKLFILDLIY